MAKKHRQRLPKRRRPHRRGITGRDSATRHLVIESLENRLLLYHVPYFEGVTDTGTYSLPADAGYLAFSPAAITDEISRLGEEWTGWVDIKHPALDGTTDTMLGYDRSDHAVTLRALVVTDDTTPTPQTATPDIPRDLHFSNKVFAQAGVSVMLDSPATGITVSDVTFPLSNSKTKFVELDTVFVDPNRSPVATVINVFYGQNLDDDPDTTNTDESTVSGATIRPSSSTSTNDGTFMADTSGNSTLSHELAHSLLNQGNDDHPQRGNSDADNPTNVLSSLTTRTEPLAVDPLLDANYDFDMIGFRRGVLTPDQIRTLDSQPGPKAFVNFDDGSSGYGHQVDWDFVVDHKGLEAGTTHADNHPGSDPLVWERSASISHTPDNSHESTGLGTFSHPGAYSTTSTFRVVDVFSISTRYTDYETVAELLALEEAALDYDVTFVSTSGTEHTGILAKVFEQGWSTTTFADDALGRWLSPVDAVAVKIDARTEDMHDGITQIDAVVAGTITNSVYGSVFQDNDGDSPNGQFDDGENLHEGVDVSLVHASDSSLNRTVTTDHYGNYAFIDLNGGTYHLVFERPYGEVFTTLEGTTNTAGSHVNSSGHTDTFTVSTTGHTVRNAGTVPSDDVDELADILRSAGPAVDDVATFSEEDDSPGSGFIVGLATSSSVTSNLPDIPFLDTSLADLVDINQVITDLVEGLIGPVVLEAEAVPSSYILTDDAVLMVSLGDGVDHEVWITTAATADNLDVVDLVADLNDALITAGLSEQLLGRVLSDGTLAIENAPNANVPSLSVATLVMTGEGAGIDPDVAQFGQLSTGPITNLTIELDIEQRDENGTLLPSLTEHKPPCDRVVSRYNVPI